jgi:predicted nuclease of restriction endonuclease-like (RecB) superfamily
VNTPDPLSTAIEATTPAASMPGWYGDLLGAVSGHVASGRRRALASVNSELVQTYWRIGREILDRQDREGYGTKVIDRLSADLKAAFPDAKGFSSRNLKYMRAFAAAWPEPEVVQRCAAQLPWRHHQTLLDKLDDLPTRLWYAERAIEAGWSRDVLVHQIGTRLHQRSGQAVTNFDRTLPGPQGELAQQLTKDPYLFDFLSVTEPKLERDLEQALIDHVIAFLLELGQGFALVGRQRRLTIGSQDFYPDLLFYHLRLRRYVVIELKARAFAPGDLGQLGLYLAAIDDLVAHPDDEPTIGLLLCRGKDNVVAEYALRSFAAPVGVADWVDKLTTELPDDLAASLPSIETIEAELSNPDLPNPEPANTEQDHA